LIVRERLSEDEKMLSERLRCFQSHQNGSQSHVPCLKKQGGALTALVAPAAPESRQSGQSRTCRKPDVIGMGIKDGGGLKASWNAFPKLPNILTSITQSRGPRNTWTVSAIHPGQMVYHNYDCPCNPSRTDSLSQL
jgi:hypothetical protein